MNKVKKYKLDNVIIQIKYVIIHIVTDKNMNKNALKKIKEIKPRVERILLYKNTTKKKEFLYYWDLLLEIEKELINQNN